MAKTEEQTCAGFLLLEALMSTLIAVLLGMVILSATSRALVYARNASLLNDAVQIASTTLDQALATGTVPHQASQGSYTIDTQDFGAQHYRVTVSWRTARGAEQVVLESATHASVKGK